MNRKWAFITLTIPVLAGLIGAQTITLAATPESQDQKQKSKSANKTENASLTGCIDEQDGHYVLVDDRALTPIADLEADGFPTEAFAKHVGHKVTVRGISSSGTSRPVFKVRSVDTISDTCAPKNH
jgi:hypothetical protein